MSSHNIIIFLYRNKKNQYILVEKSMLSRTVKTVTKVCGFYQEKGVLGCIQPVKAVISLHINVI